MDTQKTYSYRQNGQSEGPYFRAQITSMFNAGTIHADAIIVCHEDKSQCPIGKFIGEPEAAKSEVVIKDVNVSFERTTSTAAKYIGSIVLICLTITALFFIARLFYAMATGE